MRFMKFLAGAGLAAMLVACGGGGGVGSGDTGSGGASTSTATSITLTSSAANISTATGAANATVTITAEVRNAAGTGVSGEPVTFTTDSGALTSASTATGTGLLGGGSLGRATAILSVGTDRTPRDITVTVRVGSVSSKIVVPVVSAAATIEVFSSSPTVSSVAGAVGSVATITAIVKNSANNGISDEPVTFTADSGVLQEASVTTGVNGVSTVLLSAGTDTTPRNITVTVKAGSVSNKVVVAVTNVGMSTVTSIDLFSSSSTLSSTLGSTVTITAIVKNAGNNGIANETVKFAADSGVLQGASAQTSATGSATVVLSAGANLTPRNITVTVTAGAVTKNIVVPVSAITPSTVATIEALSSAVSLPSGTGSSVTITALVKNGANNGVAAEVVKFSADSGVLQDASPVTSANGTATATLSAGADKSQRNITITVAAGTVSQKIVVPVSGTTIGIAGASSLLLNGVESYAVSLKDSGGKAVVGVDVQVTSTLANTLTPAKVTTDSNGTATFKYTATKNGDDTLSVSGAGVSAQQRVSVSNVNFAFTSPLSGSNPLVPVNTVQTVKVRYLEGVAGKAGKTVYFSSTRGEVLSPTSAVTDVDGYASATVRSATAGPATISAQLDSTVTTTVINYYAAAPFSITVEANAAAIPPNAAGTTANSAAIIAILRDVTGNPVQGAVVNFSLLQDTSGGTITPGIAVSDANGRVAASFIPGATTTGQNGVVIMATTTKLDGTTLSPIKPAYVTVSTRALFITISTSNTISNRVGDDTVYQKPFSVLVNDAAGAPVVGQPVSLMVWPTRYAKGNMIKDPNILTTSWIPVVAATCDNEDANKNGFLDAGEDKNGDTILQPGGPGTISPSTVTTDSTGFATFNLYYGEQYALWTEFEITAGATVAGTESRTMTLPFWAPAMLSDLTSEATPAGYISPFGTAASCTSPR